MNTAEFLFPRDLECTPTEFKKVIFIGSCLSDSYVVKLRKRNPNAIYDFVLFNNATDLPERTAEQIGEYDLQYIQLPLRSVLTDAVIRIADNERAEYPHDWLAVGKQNIDLMLEKATLYNRMTGILTIVSNFIVPQGRIAASLSEQDGENDIVRVVRDLNSYLARRISELSNTYLADIDMIANSVGKRFFMDDIIFFYTHGAAFYSDWAHHERFPTWTAPAPGRMEEIPDLGETYENKSDEFFDAVFRQIDCIYRIVRQIDMVKVVIFDLDNTMWRGQLAEHYGEGMKWPYVDGWPMGVWESVSHLRRRGIAVSLSSKNDESLVIKKWHDAVEPPFVKFEDFLIPKINWTNKAENIQSILTALSLTARSAVFVDDNPVERESVRALIPGIRVIGSDPFKIRRILLWSPETQIANRTDESSRRESMLRRQVERETQRASMSRQEFLDSLGSVVKMSEIRSVENRLFNRALELVNKTNQFNTTGGRWSVEDCRKHLERSGRIFAFSVSDRFTDYGSVGVIFLLDRDIIQFVMSCRVLGMDIELAVLARLVELIRSDRKDKNILAIMKHTDSNTPCRDLYTRAGFIPAVGVSYVLEADKSIVEVPHVQIELELH
jgi:FkbH-like protein